MIRYRMFFDFVKEETWLNEMARQGWQLTGVRVPAYHFRQAAVQDVQIRIDFRTFASQAEFMNYKTLFEDSGWQHIAGSQRSGGQYFRRLAPDSTEDIFSDSRSRAERYRRYAQMWLTLAVALILPLAVLLFNGAIDLRALIQPKRFYLTPGLWGLAGDVFWRAFWFETPFAIFRALLVYALPVSLVLYLAFALLSERLYRKERNEHGEA